MSQSIKTLVHVLAPLSLSLQVDKYENSNGASVRFCPNALVVAPMVGRTVDQVIEEINANGGSFTIHVSNGEVAFISGNDEAIAHPDNYQGVILAIGALFDDLAAADYHSVFTTGKTITETAIEREEAGASPLPLTAEEIEQIKTARLAPAGATGATGAGCPDDIKESMLRYRLSGMTYQAIADKLTSDGVPTVSHGKIWYASYVRYVIKNA